MDKGEGSLLSNYWFYMIPQLQDLFEIVAIGIFFCVLANFDDGFCKSIGLGLMAFLLFFILAILTPSEEQMLMIYGDREGICHEQKDS